MLNLDATKAAPELTDHAKCMATVAYGGYTNQQLSDAFDLVKSDVHWKYPIDKVIEGATRAQLDLIETAIRYYAGGGVSFQHLPDRCVRVRAAGYYNLIGA